MSRRRPIKEIRKEIEDEIVPGVNAQPEPAQVTRLKDRDVIIRFYTREMLLKDPWHAVRRYPPSGIDVELLNLALECLEKCRIQNREAPRQPDLQFGIETRIFSKMTSLSQLLGEPLMDLLEKTPSCLLLQTIITTGSSTNEGKLVEAIALPWFDIIAFLGKDPSNAFQIPPEKWEEIVAGAYKKAGFDEVTLTPRSGDYGRDVIAVKRALGTIRVIDQVKAYKPGHLVNANDVRALVGVLHGDGASKGFLTTTSDFAPRIAKDPLIVPFFPTRLELVNGVTLIARLRELAHQNAP